MHIVIALPDETYKAIKEEKGIYNIDNGLCTRITGKVVGAIQVGTLLPKGYGDLIDRKELLENKYEIDSMYCEYDEVVNVDDIKDATPIIKADTESEE